MYFVSFVALEPSPFHTMHVSLMAASRPRTDPISFPAIEAADSIAVKLVESSKSLIPTQGLQIDLPLLPLDL
jgi:hypothetical protein